MKQILILIIVILFSASCKKEVPMVTQAVNSACSDSVAFVGDSFFDDWWPLLESVPTLYAKAYNKNSGNYIKYNKGGATSTPITDTFLSLNVPLSWTLFIWMGHNNHWHTETVLADLERITKGRKHFYILELTSGNSADRWPGEPMGYDEQTVRLNNLIEAEFGKEHFIRLREPLSHFTNGSIQDSIDVSHNCLPTSMMWDWLHPGTKANQHIVDILVKLRGSCNIKESL